MNNQALSQKEKERLERLKKAKSFADDVVNQCKQQNFTIAQFEQLVETLDIKRQLLIMQATDKTKMTD